MALPWWQHINIVLDVIIIISIIIIIVNKSPSTNSKQVVLKFNNYCRPNLNEIGPSLIMLPIICHNSQLL